MKKTPWIAGAAFAASIGVAAFAAAPDGRPDGRAPQTRAEVQTRVAEHFKTLDANGDGFVTKAEADRARDAMKAKFAQHRAERRAEQFERLDADKNGALSKEEFATRTPRGDRLDGKDGHRGMRGHDGKGGMHHGRGRGMGMGMGMGMGGGWIDRADANKDGKLSLAEASSGPLAMFDKADADRNGTISPAEHRAARDAMRAKWQERRAAEQPKG